MVTDKTNNLAIFLQEIANAIRTVKNTTEPINAQDFATLILSLVDNSPTLSALGQVTSNNTIVLMSSLVENGTYTLKYEQSNNIPIENFADICTLTVTNTDATYSYLLQDNIAPYLATQIGVYNNEGTRIGVIPLLTLKPTYDERLYRFGLLSDVHDYEGSTALPSDDFRNALKLFNDKEDVVMTCICGDISQDGTTEEFALYQEDVSIQSPDTPVYTTTGNHDAQSQINTTTWERYTGNAPTFEQSYTASNGKTDHFLFLGMHKWDFEDAYSSTDLTWLENKLEEYKDERCFVFTHLFFPTRSGNLNDIYPSYNWLSGEQLTRLQNMCDTYINSIWFSGHSHWKWEMQSFQDRANIYRTYNIAGKPTCGWCVHVPSCAEPRITTTGSDRIDQPLESQGAVVDVYENYIDVLGVDFISGKYLPIATYRLDTTGHVVIRTNSIVHTLEVSNFYPSGSDESTTAPILEKVGNDFKVTFYSKSSRLNYWCEDFTNDVSRVVLLHDGYSFDIDETNVDVSRVGFLILTDENGNTTYSLESETALQYSIDNTYDKNPDTSTHRTNMKIELNVSSSYSKTQFPFTITIKNPRFVIEK